MSKMPKILLLTDYYLPGYKSGGPIQTVANLVDNLGDEFQFYIVTRDRDTQDDSPYDEVAINAWNTVGKGRVYYASPGPDWPLRLMQLASQVKPDHIYLNSFFSPRFTILPLVLRKLGLFPKAPMTIAPRGEFHRGALELKATKKEIYSRVAAHLGLYDDVHWCATSPQEAVFIRERIADNASVRIAPNLGCVKEASRNPTARPKSAGTVRFVVVARVSPIKNHHRSLQWMRRLNGKVRFDIYGPIGDESYWHKCREVIDDMPENVTVEYWGPLPHQEVHQRLRDYDFFLMPSSSENHGHAIVEAMMAGCPPVISTGTPWRGLLPEKVGKDLPLDRDELFVEELQHCVDMAAEEYETWSRNTHKYGRRSVCSEAALRLNRELFSSSKDNLRKARST